MAADSSISCVIPTHAHIRLSQVINSKEIDEYVKIIT